VKDYPYKVGDIVVPACGNSRYRGVITYISQAEDIVRHRCLATGTEYKKSFIGFRCRYMTEQEKAVKDAELARQSKSNVWSIHHRIQRNIP